MEILRNLLHFLALVVFMGSTCAAQSLVWHQTNGPYGGNISALAANSTTVFAGLKPQSGPQQESHSLYRSTNTGDFWVAADSGLPAGSPITVLTASNQLIFAACDSGIYRSTNDGIFWARVDTSLHSEQILSLANSEGTVVASTSEGTIYRSEDSGNTWTIALNLADTSMGYAEQPEIKPIIIVGCVVLAGTYGDLPTGPDTTCVWRSTDNGKTWHPSGNGIFHPFQTTDLAWSGSDLFLTCLNGGLYRSTDTGYSWSVVDTSGTLSQPNELAAMNSLLVVHTSIPNGLFRSANTGQVWLSPRKSFTARVSELIVQDSEFYAGTDAGLFRSSDSGATWSESDSGIVNSNITSIAKDLSGIYASVYGGNVYRLKSANASWTAIGDRLPSEYLTCLAISGKKLFVGTEGAGLFEYNSDSSLWQSDSSLNCNGVVFSLVAAGSHLLAGTQNGVQGSTDSGVTWSIVNGQNNGRSIFASGNMLLAGSDNSRIDISRDGGSMWSDTQFLSYQPTTITSFTMNGETIFAANGGVIRSMDSGTTWNLVDTPSIYGSARVLASNQGLIFVGGVKGVVISTDNGESWVQENSGLNDIQIYALAIKGDTLFAGTETGGVYWTDISSLPSSVSPSVKDGSVECILSPNPSQGEAAFHIDLPKTEDISIRVSDPVGRVVWNTERFLPAGEQRIEFNQQDLPSGAYFYHIRTAGNTASGTLLIEQ